VGSKIDGEIVRVSYLGKRFLRLFEEYKGNLVRDFSHLESNGQ